MDVHSIIQTGSKKFIDGQPMYLKQTTALTRNNWFRSDSGTVFYQTTMLVSPESAGKIVSSDQSTCHTHSITEFCMMPLFYQPAIGEYDVSLSYRL